MLICESAGAYSKCDGCDHSVAHELLPVIEGGYCDVTGLCGHVPGIKVRCAAEQGESAPTDAEQANHEICPECGSPLSGLPGQKVSDCGCITLPK